MKKSNSAATGEVAAFLAACPHALLAELDSLRSIVQKAAPQLVEGIKWNAPSYRLGDVDLLTFNLSAKDRVRLIFHTGAKVKGGKGKGRLLTDDHGLLEWAAEDRAIATFRNAADVQVAKAALTKLVKAWLAAAAPSSTAPPPKR